MLRTYTAPRSTGDRTPPWARRDCPGRDRVEVSWASYAPGESYLVVTTGLLWRKHRVLPAGAVVAVGDGTVRVSLSRLEIEQLPLLPHPQAPVQGETTQQMLNAFEREVSLSNRQ